MLPKRLTEIECLPDRERQRRQGVRSILILRTQWIRIMQRTGVEPAVGVVGGRTKCSTASGLPCACWAPAIGFLA